MFDQSMRGIRKSEAVIPAARGRCHGCSARYFTPRERAMVFRPLPNALAYCRAVQSRSKAAETVDVAEGRRKAVVGDGEDADLDRPPCPRQEMEDRAGAVLPRAEVGFGDRRGPARTLGRLEDLDDLLQPVQDLPVLGIRHR